MLTKHIELTEKIIGVFYEVYNALKFGFSEKIYENAFAIELRKRGFDVKQQVPIRVYYAGQIVGEYFADLLINDLVILILQGLALDMCIEHGSYFKTNRSFDAFCIVLRVA